MARYIKLEDAIEVCGKYRDFHKKENSRLGMSIVNEIYLDIDNLPTADVEEVKHGYWITDEKGIVICSECGEEHAWDEYRATYCEDCGAKMDGGKKE